MVHLLKFNVPAGVLDRLRLAALDQDVPLTEACRRAILSGLIRQCEIDEVSPEVGGGTDAEVEVALARRTRRIA